MEIKELVEKLWIDTYHCESCGFDGCILDSQGVEIINDFANDMKHHNVDNKEINKYVNKSCVVVHRRMCREADRTYQEGTPLPACVKEWIKNNWKGQEE